MHLSGQSYLDRRYGTRMLHWDPYLAVHQDNLEAESEGILLMPKMRVKKYIKTIQYIQNSKEKEDTLAIVYCAVIFTIMRIFNMKVKECTALKLYIQTSK